MVIRGDVATLAIGLLSAATEIPERGVILMTDLQDAAMGTQGTEVTLTRGVALS